MWLGLLLISLLKGACFNRVNEGIKCLLVQVMGDENSHQGKLVFLRRTRHIIHHKSKLAPSFQVKIQLTLMSCAKKLYLTIIFKV